MSEHFIRLGMSLEMKLKIEEWRSKQYNLTGKVPSFSESCRRLIESGLDK